MNRLRLAAIAGLSGIALSCTGSLSEPSGDSNAPNPASGGTSGLPGGSAGMNPLNPGGDPVLPFTAVSPYSAVRKVKNLLVGLPPSDAEVAAVKAEIDAGGDGSAALKTLIEGFITTAGTTERFKAKMVFFFRNTFQQYGFTPAEDFKPQLLENAGFDLGPTGVYGDDGFPKLVKNIEDSFALTAWEIVAAGQPFTNVLTTRQHMMTTALISTYLQIEMPNDQPFNFRFGQGGCETDADCVAPEKCVAAAFGNSMSCRLGWSVDYSGNAIPLEETLDPSSPNYMVFDDQAPATASGGGFGTNCRGTGPASIGLATPTPQSGYSMLFQRLFGFTPRYPFAASFECVEHASLPYYTASDLSDWRMVTISPKGPEPYDKPYDLPTLRGKNTLALALPRVGFFTTPAYLALWNTNDSNQHRVTANQTLLVALGQSFTSENSVVPVTNVGLSNEHSPATSPECYACHKSLDPLREFWGTQFDFNDRNDFPDGNQFSGDLGNPRPAVTGGALAFGNVNMAGGSLDDLGPLLSRVVDENAAVADAALRSVNRFAMSIAQKLCYFADSAACAESDPEFRRIALAFQNSSFDFKTLVLELFSSPLVSGLAPAETFNQRNVLVSIARRDHICQALSARLGKPDICALGLAFPQQGFGAPAGQQSNPLASARTMARTAGSIPADAFSRGSENPVTPTEPTLFFRAASELLCERVAAEVVDTDGGLFASSDLEGAFNAMAETVMGYAASDPNRIEAVTILREHYEEAESSGMGTETDALRSTFALACQSPTFSSVGL